jgi:FtsP/CotA-like multicopper oxidase with cupredoxin domain
MLTAAAAGLRTILLHCHIPEHMEAGMMAVFDVKER